MLPLRGPLLRSRIVRPLRAYSSGNKSQPIGSMLYKAHHPKDKLAIHDHSKPLNFSSGTSEQLQEIPKKADYVIVGAGPAGIAATKAIRENDPNALIVMIGEEGMPIADRPQYSKLLQKSENKVDMKTIANHYTGRVVQVEEQADGTVNVILENGRQVTGTKGVLIATGVQPDLRSLPIIPEAASSQCMTLRSSADFEHMLERLNQAESVVIYGDGYVACELSGTIKKTFPNKTVHILNPKTELLSTIFPDYMSRYIQRQLKSAGVKCSGGFRALKISSCPNGVKLTSTEGKEVECNLLIIDAPSAPSPMSIIAKDKRQVSMQAGVPCGGDLKVTGNIYTAGDVALPTTSHNRVEHYHNAEYSGRIAGLNMSGLGGRQEYDGNVPAFSGSIAGIRMTGLGQVDNALSTVGLWESIGGGEEVGDGEREGGGGGGQYRRGAIVYYDDNTRLIKGILLVNLPDGAKAKDLLSTKLPEEVSTLSQHLLASPAA